MQQLTRDSEKMLKYIFKAAEPVKVSALKKRFKASTKISINELSDIGYIYIASKLSRWGEPLEEVKYQITEDGEAYGVYHQLPCVCVPDTYLC